MSTKFVPVNYKDDWANTRRIDQVVAAGAGQAIITAAASLWPVSPRCRSAS